MDCQDIFNEFILRMESINEVKVVQYLDLFLTDGVTEKLKERFDNEGSYICSWTFRTKFFG